MRYILFVVMLFVLLTAPGLAGANSGSDNPGVVHRIVTYIPNRLLDIIDIVRLRGRLGPGTAVGIRATEYADIYIGSYASVYAGLPGPRCRKLPRLPIGLESNTGAEASVADISTGAGTGPDYSATEFGLGFQILLLGLDIGIDPLEILDFAVGLFCFDIREDDY